MSFQEIPLVSLSCWNGPDAQPEAFAERLRTICHEVGFLRVVDHGVDPAFLDEYFSVMARFFALPDEVKAKIDKAHSPWFRGWERIGTELTDAKVDHREQVDVWSELEPVAAGDGPAYLALQGPNQWPDEDLPGLRPLVERFQAEMGAIADELMAAMSVGLGFDRDHLAKRFGSDRMSLVKLIHYPPTPAGGAGVNGHHDTGFVTLLWQHRVGGLQVENRDGDWVDVPVDDGVLIVNLGEMLQAMTGNYFVATNHRVISDQERYSSAYFHGPELTCPLTPLALPERFVEAVAASPHHREAGFMAKPDELARGERGIGSDATDTYGQQLWNYFTRSYPDLVAQHHPGVG